MARGWGKNEEDLQADKESARDERSSAADAAHRADARRRVDRHAIELSLARIAEQLGKTAHPERREALEAARRELEAKLKGIE